MKGLFDHFTSHRKCAPGYSTIIRPRVIRPFHSAPRPALFVSILFFDACQRIEWGSPACQRIDGGLRMSTHRLKHSGLFDTGLFDHFTVHRDPRFSFQVCFSRMSTDRINDSTQHLGVLEDAFLLQHKRMYIHTQGQDSRTSRTIAPPAAPYRERWRMHHPHHNTICSEPMIFCKCFDYKANK